MASEEKAGSVRALVQRRDGSEESFGEDALVVEEPLEVRVGEEAGDPVRLLVTMRTPGQDEDLAAGLLFSEGVIESPEEILGFSRPDDPSLAPELARNVLIARLAPCRGGRRLTLRHGGYVSSACGVCGDLSIGEVAERAAAARRRSRDEDREGPVVAASLLSALPDALRREQALFRSTGGLHAAGLFEEDGRAAVVREDVGRHNATDKSIGACLRERRPVPPILLVSGRLGFEIAQKAALAGVRILCSVSAPTSLAVELSEETGMTVVGFLRGERFNVYTHPARVRAGG
ncbi:MAG: formate dehydrogenase accessory sulfurtransferase FdhD [Thermoanaerobaculia bacterium]